MARYASGKKSLAISDISGLRVPYTKLRTTWDGLRVSPEDFDPKQPQLTPAKNVVDATALFNPRPDTDPENVVVYIGFTQDWTIDPRLLPPVGVPSIGTVGYVNLEITPTQTGVGGTGAVGTETLEMSINEVGVAGTGAVGTITFLQASRACLAVVARAVSALRLSAYPLMRMALQAQEQWARRLSSYPLMKLELQARVL
jgi:hypothetical protein